MPRERAYGCVMTSEADSEREQLAKRRRIAEEAVAKARDSLAAVTAEVEAIGRDRTAMSHDARSREVLAEQELADAEQELEVVTLLLSHFDDLA